MGMDVYGKNPKSEKGKYFRNNVWWWRPLANYVCGVAPDITSQCDHWQSNDGDGLDDIRAEALAKILREEITSGKTKAYSDNYAAQIAALPDKECWLCHGTGTRSDDLGISHGHTEKVIDKEGHPRFGQKGWCSGCDGTGYQEADAKSYPFSVENVEEFCDFIESCGGFEIH